MEELSGELTALAVPRATPGALAQAGGLAFPARAPS